MDNYSIKKTTEIYPLFDVDMDTHGVIESICFNKEFKQITNHKFNRWEVYGSCVSFMTEGTFEYLFNFNIYKKMGNFLVPEYQVVPDDLCVKLFELNIGIRYYRNNTMVWYDQEAITRRHNLNKIINE